MITAAWYRSILSACSTTCALSAEGTMHTLNYGWVYVHWCDILHGILVCSCLNCTLMQIRKWHAKIIAVLKSTLRSECLLGHHRDWLPKAWSACKCVWICNISYLYIIHDIVWVRGMIDGERISSNTIAIVIVPVLYFSVCSFGANVVVSPCRGFIWIQSIHQCALWNAF